MRLPDEVRLTTLVKPHVSVPLSRTSIAIDVPASNNLARNLYGCELVAIALRLERPVRLDADIRGLFRRQLGQLRAQLVEVQAGHFLIQLLRQQVDLLV